MGYSIRTATHRYTRWIDWTNRATVAEELYDYTATDSVRSLDSCLIEQANVVQDPARAAVRDRLREQMNQTITTPAPVGSTASARKKKRKQP